MSPDDAYLLVRPQAGPGRQAQQEHSFSGDEEVASVLTNLNKGRCCRGAAGCGRGAGRGVRHLRGSGLSCPARGEPPRSCYFYLHFPEEEAGTREAIVAHDH